MPSNFPLLKIKLMKIDKKETTNKRCAVTFESYGNSVILYMKKLKC